ncbi:hypothetical protein H9P43_009672 [Blastocladiella emersonii ATCC 22665]|nr:hypothetical protein H9P43_009672 [Blastocladiella emersonii ATCC 22665]
MIALVDGLVTSPRGSDVSDFARLAAYCPAIFCCYPAINWLPDAWVLLVDPLTDDQWRELQQKLVSRFHDAVRCWPTTSERAADAWEWRVAPVHRRFLQALIDVEYPGAPRIHDPVTEPVKRPNKIASFFNDLFKDRRLKAKSKALRDSMAVSLDDAAGPWPQFAEKVEPADVSRIGVNGLGLQMLTVIKQYTGNERNARWLAESVTTLRGQLWRMSPALVDEILSAPWAGAQKRGLAVYFAGARASGVLASEEAYAKVRKWMKSMN